jgi:DNA-binding SARP family transcriptional activator/pimeloyl-ACP methyl ester carboxylesterase
MRGDTVEFRILGPLEVVAGERRLAVGGARTRAVLALLLMNANRVVPADVLIRELWPDLAPDRAAANLHVRLSELRKALRTVAQDDRLQTRPPGYSLRVASDELDVLRFEQLVTASRGALASGDADAAVRLLDQSLALWRGLALADIDDAQFAGIEQARLEEARLGALESRIDALLACGRHQDTVTELETLTRDHPLRERFWHQRLLALYRSGRQAEALRAYRELRSTLVDELGIEPGPELRELEMRILRQDATLEYRAARKAGRDVDATPQTYYVESSGVHIAYQVVGDGERDVLFVPGLMSHVELAWEDPGTVAFYRRLASLGRLILFDKRDTGLSDRAPGDSSLEERIDDVQAVMSAASSERAIVFGYSEGAPMSILFAATYPEKVSSLILGSAFARWFPAPDYPCGPGAQEVYTAMHEIATHRWGQGATIDWFLPSRSGSHHTRQALARFERMTISPSAYLRMLRLIREIDVRAVLPAIHVPTLVIQRLGDRINPPFYGRYLASHIPGARYFEQPGDHVLRFAEGEDLDELFSEIEDLLAAAPGPAEPARVLTTILLAAGVEGGIASSRVRSHSGVVRSSNGERILATFDAPGQAIRCAAAIREDAATTGMRFRAGIHTGEVGLAGDGIAGLSVEIADRVAANAQPAEILVSRAVKDLVVGSGISFAERGSYALAANDDRLPLFAVTTC